MPYMPPSSPGAVEMALSESDLVEHHRLYHGSIPGSDDFDVPIVPHKRRVDMSSPLIIHTGGPDFDHAPTSHKQLRQQRSNCHYCQLATFPHSTRFPVTITNTVDTTFLPRNFTFIKQSILCEGVEIAGEEFMTGCDCPTPWDCNTLRCLCLQDMEFSGESYAYIPSGKFKDCLREQVLESRAAIYECHPKCKCAADCQNAVVGRGRKVPLDIFRTDDRGWGVRSNVNIKEGQFIDKYVGEVITAKEALRRRDASEKAARKDVYLFALDKFSNAAAIDERLRGDPLEVDGEFKSGPTRFINHSCDPNLRIFARVGDQSNRHIHDLAFFAIRDIKAGEELTFDYIDGVDEDDLDVEDPSKRKDMTRCLCGAENCRGFLW